MASLAGFLGFMSAAFTVGSKTLNEKITKHEKTISKAEENTCQYAGPGYSKLD